MSNFIVLGLIPGTGFQVTFNSWLIIIGLLAAYAAAKRLRSLVTVLHIALIMRRSNIQIA